MVEWAGNYIAESRSPFRKVELGTPLVTEQGTLSADLVLWINQDSFVAGGIIALGDPSPQQLATAQVCAHALGVCYFALWGHQQVTLFQADKLSVYKQFPLADDQPKSLENTFSQLMDKFRTLAVLGACPQDRLCAWHLTNLCVGVLNKAFPAVSEHFRRDPQLHDRHLPTIAAQADQKLRIVMARLLTLLYFDKIPYTVQPEKLDLALQFLCEAGANPSFRCLQAKASEPNLDEESAVLFHHLWRRLGQIGVFRDTARAGQWLEQLLTQRAGTVENEHFAPPDRAEIQLYTDILPNENPVRVEIDSAARLALKQLLRTLHNWPLPHVQSSDIFQLTTTLHDATALAKLTNPTLMDTCHRNTCNALLRVAWPGQTPLLPLSAPLWVYEFAYLLGIMATQSRLRVLLPATALCGPCSDALVKLLQQNFTIDEISQRGTETIELQLRKSHDAGAIVHFNGQWPRTCPWSVLQTAPSEWLCLALRLPDDLYQLLDNGLLTLESAAEPATVENYQNSSLASRLRSILTTEAEQSRRSRWQPNVPRPARKILAALNELTLPANDSGAQRQLIDNKLEQLLGIQPIIAAAATADDATELRSDKNTHRKVLEQILHKVHLRGVPQFPTHYLFDFFRPPLHHFNDDNRPWQIDNEFMGSYLLHDQAQTEFITHDEFLAHAIVLASYGDAEIWLPEEAAINQTITLRYLRDLAQIHALIWRECHSALPKSYAANRLVGQIWKTLALPPWLLVEKFLLRFQLEP